ncbi:MAG: hypothetical protein ABJE95_39600 [Byssovorax sp.]
MTPLAWISLVGAATVAAVAACSSVDTQTTAGGTTGSGGQGSTGTGGAQSTASSSATTAAATTAQSTSEAASSSTGGGLECGASACADASILGFVTLPACCPMGAPPDKCGLDLSGVAQFIGVSLGCVELNQAGDADAACPDKTISAMGQMVNLPGCCRPDMLCGNVVDLSQVAPGVSFGCVNGSTFLDGGAPQSCGGGTSSSAASSGSGSGSSSNATSSGSGSGGGSGSGSSSSTGP